MEALQRSIVSRLRRLGPELGLLALSAAVAWAPPAWLQPARDLVRTMFRPGLQLAELTQTFMQSTARRIVQWNPQHIAPEQIEQELTQLQARNRELEAALITLRSFKSPDALASRLPEPPEAWLAGQLVPARVLGRQALNFLARRNWIDCGSLDGIDPGDWVVEAPPTVLDRGQNGQLEPGNLVLAGRRVWGKVAETGRTLSVVQHLTDAGYRDLVQLAQIEGATLRAGPQGVLEGTGEALVRIRHVPITEPVDVGDLVLTTGQQGLSPQPFVYGKLVRVERAHGATHWDLWMVPAVQAELPDQLAVLTGVTAALPPDRVTAATVPAAAPRTAALPASYRPGSR